MQTDRLKQQYISGSHNTFCELWTYEKFKVRTFASFSYTKLNTNARQKHKDFREIFSFNLNKETTVHILAYTSEHMYFASVSSHMHFKMLFIVVSHITYVSVYFTVMFVYSSPTICCLYVRPLSYHTSYHLLSNQHALLPHISLYTSDYMTSYYTSCTIFVYIFSKRVTTHSYFSIFCILQFIRRNKFDLWLY